MRHEEIPDFDNFSAILARMVDEIPSAFLQGVDGIFAVPEARPDPELPDVYLLGEYHQRQDGKYVYLYHGSFLAMGWRRRRQFEAEMRDTLLHELQHHWEDSCGLPDLRNEDRARMERFRARGGSRRRRQRRSAPGGWMGEVKAPLLFLGAVMAAVALVAYLVGN
jgi:hypothetical protein